MNVSGAEGHIAAVTAAVKGALDENVWAPAAGDPQAEGLAAARRKLEQARDAADAASKALQTERKLLSPDEQEWLKGVANAAKGQRLKALLKLRGEHGVSELLLDLARMAYALLAVALGWWALTGEHHSLGRFAVGLADLYLVLMLVTAALKSNATYPQLESLAKVLYYYAMPTRVAALVLIPALFVAVWLGFAALYLDAGIVALDTVNEALFFSFGGFGTYGSGIASEGARTLAMAELGNGILILICIFALVINRLSDW
jgi:hypothetical protein